MTLDHLLYKSDFRLPSCFPTLLHHGHIHSQLCWSGFLYFLWTLVRLLLYDDFINPPTTRIGSLAGLIITPNQPILWKSTLFTMALTWTKLHHFHKLMQRPVLRTVACYLHNGDYDNIEQVNNYLKLHCDMITNNLSDHGDCIRSVIG